MKCSLSLCAVVMAACGSCVPRSVPDQPNTLEERPVAQLETYTEDGASDGNCSIWKASPTLGVTAGHCCEPKDSYILRGPFAIPGAPVRLLVDDDKNDVCVLHVRMRGESLVVRLQDPDVGSKVWTVGYPHGTFLITDGYWSGRNSRNKPAISVVAAGGLSGSPIMDPSGRVVGVLSSGFGGTPVTFIVPIESIRQALLKARQLDGPED